jgi:hypothetical protein
MSFFPVHSGFDWGHHGHHGHGYGHGEGNIVNNLVVRVDEDRRPRYYDDGPYWGGRRRRRWRRSWDSDSSRSSRSSRSRSSGSSRS